MLKIRGSDAVDLARANHARRFPDRADARVRGGILFPEVSPGFRLRGGQSIFTIGSCFARNVEEELLSAGLDVPTALFAVPQDEAKGRPNRILNQYTPGSMLQAVSLLDTDPDDRGLYPKGGEGLVVDALLSTGGRPVSIDRAMARRREIATLYRDGLAKSDAVVVTLGLAESWIDRAEKVALNEIPPIPMLRAEPERFAMVQLDFATAQAEIFALIDRLIEGGRRNVMLTVSPVPFRATFAGGDAVARNSYSKAVLRVAAESALHRFPGVDYFPSYEIVSSAGLSGFMADNIHVRTEVVAQVVAYLLDTYLLK